MTAQSCIDISSPRQAERERPAKRLIVPDAWPTWPFTQLDPNVMQALLKKLKAKDDELVIATAGDAPF